jgi:CBS domain-containing protein
MLVADILREKGSTVFSIRADASVLEAAKTLEEKRVGALLVRGEGGRVEGILSERDIVLGLAQRGGGAADIAVRDLMTAMAELVSCTPTDTIDRLMSVMTDRRVRHLPVFDGGRLAGIVSIGDVVKARIRETVAEVEAMAAYVRS